MQVMAAFFATIRAVLCITIGIASPDLRDIRLSCSEIPAPEIKGLPYYGQGLKLAPA
jgi:hypothetical protein